MRWWLQVPGGAARPRSGLCSSPGPCWLLRGCRSHARGQELPRQQFACKESRHFWRPGQATVWAQREESKNLWVARWEADQGMVPHCSRPIIQDCNQSAALHGPRRSCRLCLARSFYHSVWDCTHDGSLLTVTKYKETAVLEYSVGLLYSQTTACWTTNSVMRAK